MHVRFFTDHRHRPPLPGKPTIAYRAGTEYSVKRDWGRAMIGAGVCEQVAPPRREVFP
jgi:hypothetical protein